MWENAHHSTSFPLSRQVCGLYPTSAMFVPVSNFDTKPHLDMALGVHNMTDILLFAVLNC